MRWSHPDKYTYAQHSRGEIAIGLLWLSLGALVSVLLEVVYLSFWVVLPGGHSIPLPYTIAVAFSFNWVLSATALLWTRRVPLALIPLLCWGLGYFILIFWQSLTGDMLVASSLRSIVLLLAGTCGGMIPVFISSADTVQRER